MATSLNVFEDIAKLAKSYGLPGTSIENLMQSRRKDMESLLQAGRAVGDGAQSLAQKQAELLTGALEDLRGLLKKGADGGRAEQAKQAAQRAIDSVGDMAQIVLQTQSDAFEAVRDRARENIDELKALLSPAPRKPE